VKNVKLNLGAIKVFKKSFSSNLEIKNFLPKC
jgi:hypothetical protein